MSDDLVVRDEHGLPYYNGRLCPVPQNNNGTWVAWDVMTPEVYFYGKTQKECLDKWFKAREKSDKNGFVPPSLDVR